MIGDPIGKCGLSVKPWHAKTWNLAHDGLGSGHQKSEPAPESDMPTLYRLLFFAGAIIASVYGIMLALTIFVDPGEKDMIIRIPPGSIPATSAKP